MRIINKIKSFVVWFIAAMLSLLLIANIYVIAARHFTGNPQPTVFGWSWAIIISGSMEPEIQVNDIIVAHAEEDYEVGDIISYKSGKSVITHRISEENANGYITKGDANNTTDFVPVSKKDVIGKVEFVIPKLGIVAEYLQTPLGKMCLVVIGFMIIEISYLANKHRNQKGRAQEE